MFGIGVGPSGQEETQYGNLTSASGFATGQGEGDISASDQFMRAILSGDATKTSQALAPQIGAAKKSAQQDIATRTQMGSRSGGNAAANASTGDKVHSDITSMIGQLTGGAASELGSRGSSLLGMGMSGDQAAFGEAKTLQAQNLAKINDIISSIASVAAAPFTGGASLTDLVPGSSGGFHMPGGGGAGGGFSAPQLSNLTPGAAPSIDPNLLQPSLQNLDMSMFN